MNGLATKLMVAALVVVAAAAGVGGTLGAMKFFGHGAKAATTAPLPLQKQISFVELSDIVVSIPPEQGAAATSYVQFALQFATHDPATLTSFAAFQPIIKSAIINLLMNQTSAALQDPKIRATLLAACLGVANDVLAKNTGRTTPAFDAVYISNLVVQD